MDSSIQVPAAGSRWGRLLRISGLASLVLAVLFLIAVVGPVAAQVRPGADAGWLSPFQGNWLVVLFELNAGYAGVTFDALNRVNPLDIAILALVGVTCLGLYGALRRTSRVWSTIAAVMPFLGIVVLLATGLAGRSGVMGAGLVMSIIMLRSRVFGRAIAFVGIVANALLLIGDFGTTGNSTSTAVAIALGVGYVPLTAWFFAVGRRLIQLAHDGS